jgi:hypothetical protein
VVTPDPPSASDTWLGSAVDAVAHGNDWGHFVIFVTFDDWAVGPTTWFRLWLRPQPTATPTASGRVSPAVVVGPFAKPKYVSHDRSSNVSLVAYIERLFGLPPSPNPDAARRTSAPEERAMADYIDTGQTPLPPGWPQMGYRLGLPTSDPRRRAGSGQTSDHRGRRFGGAGAVTRAAYTCCTSSCSWSHGAKERPTMAPSGERIRATV